MQFKPSDDDRMLLEAVRALADGAVRDAAAQSDRQCGPTSKIIKHLVELGAFGLQADDALGGLALGQVARARERLRVEVGGGRDDLRPDRRAWRVRSRAC